MADEVGSIALKLRLDGSDLTGQFEKITQNMQKQMQAPLDRVNENISSAFDKPMENARKSVERQSQAIKKEFTKLNEDSKRILKTGAISDIPDYLKSSDAKMPEPETPKVDLSEVFQASTDPQELLKQKLANINLQIDAERQKLAELNAEFQKVDAGSAAFDTLSGKITASESKLISLQERLNSTQAKIKKTSDSITTEADKVSKKTSDSVKKSADSSSKHMGMLGRSIKSAFKSTFVMAGLYAVFRGLKSMMTNAATQNASFAKSLNSVKANLNVAFTPIMQSIMPVLNTLMSGLAAATKAIASFISALFGKTYAESVAATKGMQKNADAAKATAESLSQASFDEMNIMSAPSSGSGSDDGSGIDYDALDMNGDAAAEGLAAKFKRAFETIGKGFYDYVIAPVKENLSKFDAPIDRFKSLFAGIGKQCAAWMQPLSDWFKTDFKNAVSVSISTVSTVLAGLMDVIATVAETIWNALAPVITWFVTDGLPLFTDMWVGLMEIVGGWFDYVKTIFDTLWTGVIEPVFTLISGIILDCFTTFQNLWET